jgi:hypothetical protein
VKVEEIADVVLATDSFASAWGSASFPRWDPAWPPLVVLAWEWGENGAGDDVMELHIQVGAHRFTLAAYGDSTVFHTETDLRLGIGDLEKLLGVDEDTAIQMDEFFDEFRRAFEMVTYAVLSPVAMEIRQRALPWLQAAATAADVCVECGQPVAPDESPTSLVHDGGQASERERDHTARRAVPA